MKAAPLAFLTAVAVGCWGCGGTSDLTRSEYARAASRICRAATTRTAALDVPGLERAMAAARAIGTIVHAHRRALEALSELDGPKRDRPRVGRWLATIDQVLDEADLAREELEKGDVYAAAAAATRAARLGSHSVELGRAYDIQSCRLPELVRDT